MSVLMSLLVSVLVRPDVSVAVSAGVRGGVRAGRVWRTFSRSSSATIAPRKGSSSLVEGMWCQRWCQRWWVGCSTITGTTTVLMANQVGMKVAPSRSVSNFRGNILRPPDTAEIDRFARKSSEFNHRACISF